MLRPSTTLNMAPVQTRVNDLFKLESSDYYGTLFEFIEKKTNVVTETKDPVDQKVRNMISKLNEGMHKEQDRLVRIFAIIDMQGFPRIKRRLNLKENLKNLDVSSKIVFYDNKRDSQCNS